MTGAFVPRISAGLVAGARCSPPRTTAGAQTPDPRWNDWLGCWNLVADGNVARLPPAEDAAGGVTGPIRPGSSRDARVCVSPSQRRRGTAHASSASSRCCRRRSSPTAPITRWPTAAAPARSARSGRPTACGSSRARRSPAKGSRRAPSPDSRSWRPDGQWVDVQAVTIGGTDSVRVRRFRPPVERARTGVPAAAVRLQVEHVKEASEHVSPRAIEAALMETSARFPLSSRVLVDLDKAGVDDRVIDLMVALSFPRSFAVRPSGPDDRLTPFPPLYPGADFVDASYDYPYFFGPYYSNYYYSPVLLLAVRLLVSPLLPVRTFCHPPSSSRARRRRRRWRRRQGRPPENGRAINGLGYTRVDRRDDATP